MVRSYGQILHEEAVLRVDPTLKIDDHLRRRVPGRLMEETVELCLECGMTAREIVGHVMDALHSESLKAKVYPTALRYEPSRASVLGELADIGLMHDYLTFINRLTNVEVRDAMGHKVDYLVERSERGEAKLIDGLLYSTLKR